MPIGRGKFDNPEMTLQQKLWQVNWGLLLLIAMVAGVGLAMLYSAANGSWKPWASGQMLRIGIGFVAMLVIALIDIRIWMRYAYAVFAIGVALLLSVEFFGEVQKGARRWIDLRVINLQPSELMKFFLVIALARYFHGLSQEEVARPTYLIAPLAIIAIPVLLILRQPDLGTALTLVIGGGVLFFIAGVRLWKFAAVFAIALAALPIAWSNMHGYQKQRVLTFLDAESDPLGAGYHIMQSKIAMGSGGVFGKGFIQGTQSHLNFLPEKQTDFIFTMLAEEVGLVGGLALMGLYALLMIYGFAIAIRSRSQFGRLVAMGVTFAFSLYVFINMAMVMGLIPVVGVPLPLVSYGGSAMVSVMIGFGFLMNVFIHRDVRMPRGATDPGF